MSLPAPRPPGPEMQPQTSAFTAGSMAADPFGAALALLGPELTRAAQADGRVVAPISLALDLAGAARGRSAAAASARVERATPPRVFVSGEVVDGDGRLLAAGSAVMRVLTGGEAAA